MAYLMCEAHIWTLVQRTNIADDNIGCFAYHLKTDPDAANHQYNEDKLQYTEGRDVTWRPRNKRPVKLRTCLQELEELVIAKKCIDIQWLSRKYLQIFLGNGTVVTCNVSTFTGDVDAIHIDKSLVNKLTGGENVSSMFLSSAYMVVAYLDKSQIDYIFFLKQPQPGKKIDKLSSLDARVVTVDIPGSAARKFERKFASSQQENLIVCWWSYGQFELMPWTPTVGEKEKANLILFSVGSFRPEMLCYARTAGDLLSVQFSETRSRQILTVEQSATASDEFRVYIGVYECDRNKLHRLSAFSIPLHSAVTCCDRSSPDDRVVLGCGDSTIVLYDPYRNLTQSAKCDLVPSAVSWHPSGCIVVVVSRRGDVQIFDVALSLIRVQLVSTDINPQSSLSLSTFLKSAPVLCQAVWNPPWASCEHALVECNDLLALTFERGPVLMLSFYFGVMHQGLMSPLQLVNQYIRTRQLSEAIEVLSTLNWNSDGRTAFACLSAIINRLLKTPLDPITEGQIQESLGLFYSPSKPLSEATILKHREAVGHLARRFFHVLLRHSRFEKAYLLAVDIGARDLFVDIHFAARDREEFVLAEVARQKADQIVGESFTRGSLQYYEPEESGSVLVDDCDSEDDQYFRSEDDMQNEELHYPNNVDVRFQSWKPQLNLSDKHVRHLDDGILRSFEESLSSALKDEFTESFLSNRRQSQSSTGNQGSLHGNVRVVRFDVV